VLHIVAVAAGVVAAAAATWFYQRRCRHRVDGQLKEPLLDRPLLPANNSHLSARGSEQQEAILATLMTSAPDSRWPESTRTSDQSTRALVLGRLRNGIDFNVEFDEIKYREVLGSGAGGCVNSATYYGADVAVKTLYIKHSPQAQEVSLILHNKSHAHAQICSDIFRYQGHSQRS
jgi:hypothetical protein